MRLLARSARYSRRGVGGACAAMTLAAVALVMPASSVGDSVTAKASANSAVPGGSEAEALTAAKRSGVSVEVSGSKSESSRVVATPQGSLVLESYAVPRWTMSRDGSGWRQIDTNLRASAERGIAPVATLVEVAFSSGGSAVAARLPLAGGEVALSWPSSLPSPRLEGDTAVYESVLPGVDLRMRALVDGFTWVLVVKSAEAAANPALNELRLQLDTPGLSMRERVSGGFEVLDGAGAPVLSAGKGLMWDSSGLVPANRAADDPAPSASGAEENDDALRVVPDLARKAELAIEVDGADLVVVPDTSILRGSDTVFPVMIDPYTTIGKIRWGYANQTNATRDDGVVRVGENPDGSGIYRSFFSFGLVGLSGRTIRSAKFLTEMTHSWACTSTPVNLWRTADLTTTGKQAWDGPNLAVWLEQRSAHAHKPPAQPSCEDDPQPDAPMEFSSTNLKDDIIANRGQVVYTLALSTRQSDGSSESTSTWWKKFDPALTKLTVEYNTNPNTPTASQLSTHADYTAPAQACVTGASRPMVRADFPWLKAVLTDQDGTNGGSLSGVFTVQKWNGTAWAAVTGWPKTDAGVANGAKAEVQFTTKTINGEQYRWQVQTKDTLGGASGASAWCEFYIDYSAPAATPTVAPTDGLYLESPPLGTNQDVRGSIGYSGRFTFSANGATDVYDYVYQIAGGSQMIVSAPTLGGSATVWVTPNSIGENVLTVRSRDQAGNASAPYDYVFLVDTASAPKAAWAMNEGAGTTLGNQISGGPSATLTNGANWSESRLLGTHKTKGQDFAVGFDGVDDMATTPGLVLDTSRSFSVSAWARTDTISGSHVVLSQPGTNRSPFELQYYPTTQKWCFVTYSADAVNSNATTSPACAAATVRVGLWTHLTAVYDVSASSQLSLYVNGVKDGTGSSAPMWASTGPFTIGAARNGTPAARFKGAIDDVRVWNRVVEPALDLAPLVEPVLTGQWEMEDYDEEAPRQEGDGSGFQRPVNLVDAPAAQWTAEGYNFSSGLALDGVTGAANSAVPVVRTDQSFTVSAWVKPTSLNHQTVLAQDGQNWSAFYLMLNGPTHQWVLTMPTADTSTVGWQANYSTSLAQLDTWTHLAAVYDAQARQLKLYVNGVPEAIRTNTTGWHGGSAFHIGRAIGGNHTAGSIDRVRIWAGARSEAEISALSQES